MKELAVMEQVDYGMMARTGSLVYVLLLHWCLESADRCVVVIKKIKMC